MSHGQNSSTLVAFRRGTSSIFCVWFVADSRWDESSGGKVLKLKHDFVMALDDRSSFLALKVMSYGEFSSTAIAMSVSYKIEVSMHLNSISERQVPLTYRNLEGFAATCLFLGFENVVRLAAPGIGAVIRLSSCSCRLSLVVRIAAFAAMVWVCLAVSKVVSSFRALMRWQKSFLLAW